MTEPDKPFPRPEVIKALRSQLAQAKSSACSHGLMRAHCRLEHDDQEA